MITRTPFHPSVDLGGSQEAYVITFSFGCLIYYVTKSSHILSFFAYKKRPLCVYFVFDIVVTPILSRYKAILRVYCIFVSFLV